MSDSQSEVVAIYPTAISPDRVSSDERRPRSHHGIKDHCPRVLSAARSTDWQLRRACEPETDETKTAHASVQPLYVRSDPKARCARSRWLRRAPCVDLPSLPIAKRPTLAYRLWNLCVDRERPPRSPVDERGAALPHGLPRTVHSWRCYGLRYVLRRHWRFHCCRNLRRCESGNG